MIKILSAAQIREVDQYTIKHEPVESIDLMERAAGKFTEYFIKEFPSARSIYIFCGYGNNGGDGLAIARMLLQKNYAVYAFIMANKKKYSPDFLVNESRLIGLNKGPVNYLEYSRQFPEIPPGSVIIDALFGSGLNKPMQGFAKHLVTYLNNVDAFRIAVDIPSGLLADTFSEGITLNAHQTITFQQPKLAFLFPENHKSTGNWKAIDIGLDKKFIESVPSPNSIIEKEDIKNIIRPREKFDHKGTFGHAFIHAGNKGRMGAAIMCAGACLRSGAGLTTVHLPKNQSLPLNAALPEAMTEEYGAQKSFTTNHLSKFNAFAFGPGMGTDRAAREIFHSLLKKIETPAVFDADALTLLSQEKKWFRLIPPNSILTPHPKEFERIAGKSDNWYERHKLQLELSKKYTIYIVLKGAFTCVSTPEGISYFNSTGNPGMAKGGSGDVLTGMIASFLAQKYTPEQSCLLGVYLHGLAADIAVQKESPYSLIATDIINNIGMAFRQICDADN